MQLQTVDHHLKDAEEKAEELQMVKKRMESNVVDKYKELKILESQVESEYEKLQLIGQRYIKLEKKMKQKEYNSTMDQLPDEEISIPFLGKEVITEV